MSLSNTKTYKEFQREFFLRMDELSGSGEMKSLQKEFDEQKYATLEDIQKIQDNLNKLYEFVCQGSIQSSDNMAKAAFATMKYRMEILFPELVKTKPVKPQLAFLQAAQKIFEKNIRGIHGHIKSEGRRANDGRCLYYGTEQVHIEMAIIRKPTRHLEIGLHLEDNEGIRLDRCKSLEDKQAQIEKTLGEPVTFSNNHKAKAKRGNSRMMLKNIDAKELTEINRNTGLYKMFMLYSILRPCLKTWEEEDQKREDLK